MASEILIVDDNRLVLLTLKRLLKGAGYNVTIASSGTEALEKIKTKNFDLVITDIRMPEMDGIEMIKRLRQMLKEEERDPIPELVITAYITEDNQTRVEKLNVASYITKPFDMKDVLSSIEKSLTKKKPIEKVESIQPARAERRRFMRANFKLPIDLLIYDEKGNTQKTVRVEITDISETGMKVVSNEPLVPLSTIKAYLNLPPCYSGDPKKAKGIEVETKVIWSHPTAQKNRIFSGHQFLNISKEDMEILKGFIRYEIEKSAQASFLTLRPKIQIKREPHSCNMYAVDLSIGCENECKYCHFSKLNQEQWKKKYPLCKDFPILVDLSPIYKMEKLPETVVYLSPSSDAFTPNTQELTHELLSCMLPRGVIFTISTKAIIPDKTIKLLKKYYRQIEGIAIGITNLDDERNKLLEPTCPPAKARLEHMRQLKEISCSIGARMDPLFPLIDDTDENLNSTIKEIAKAGAGYISGTYFFSYGKFLKELNEIPQLKESLKMMKEKTYPVGGVALSPPLEYKKATYEKMNEICKQYGVTFATCGCKEIRLKEENYSLICRNLDYYTNMSKDK